VIIHQTVLLWPTLHVSLWDNNAAQEPQVYFVTHTTFKGQ